MRKLIAAAAAVSALAVLGAESPALAAMGQCFDGYGRPIGGPYSTDNPPYGRLCAAFRAGGSCTGVQPQWAENNCGLAPRYRYRDSYRENWRYRDDDWRYRQRYDY